MNSESRLRIPLMLVAIATLLAALWAGLYRIGWQVPAIRPTLPMAHGPLMVSGLLGTVIGLERAVALGKRWTYIGPALSAAGAALLIADGSSLAGPVLVTLSSLAFVVLSLDMVKRVPALYTGTMAIGAVTWLVGNVLWLSGWAVSEIVYWWSAFLILTIVGERLELSRVTRPGRNARLLFGLAMVVTIGGLVWSIFDYQPGVRLTSIGYIFFALWLAVYDIARRTIRLSGLTRFIAVNLLLGYWWLLVGGFLGARYAGVIAGPTYDAMLHSLFMGFVLSMIIAHALVIVPAVSGVQVPYHRLFYGPVILLHFSLILRIVGDLNLWGWVRLWGGLLNVVAVLWFLLMLVVFAIRERRGGKQV